MTDTMKIWDAVSKTNPANTKKVSQRGGFISICAQSQIMEATRQFGAIGEGWGYEVGAPIFQGRLMFVPVTLWHGERGNTFGPQMSGAEWEDKNGRIDSDAGKKATTDAITKLLSQLGFNADVFLGLFDDNKYVAQVSQEFAPKVEYISDADVTKVMDLLQAHNIPIGDLLAAAKVKKLTEVTAERAPAVINWINNRIAKNAEKET